MRTSQHDRETLRQDLETACQRARQSERHGEPGVIVEAGVLANIILDLEEAEDLLTKVMEALFKNDGMCPFCEDEGQHCPKRRRVIGEGQCPIAAFLGEDDL